MTASKIVAAASSGAGGGAGLDVNEVFSTHLYTGNDGTHVIDNNIALGNSNAGSSVEFAGIGGNNSKQSLSYANNSNYVVGSSNNFTIEFFVYLRKTDDNLAFGLIGAYSTMLTGMYISGGNLSGYYQTGSSAQTQIATGQVLSAGQFYHIALVRNGTAFAVYLNGTSVGTSTSSSSIHNASQFFTVGNYTNNQNDTINGFVSNLRYSSTARYTGNFTPTTSNFTNDSDTILLSCQGQTSDLSSNSIAVTENGSAPTLHDDFGPFTGTSGEGGLVWSKRRDGTTYHNFTDTVRGGQYTLYTGANNAQVDKGNDYITSFNSNGYTMGGDSLINDANSHVSWTFRKAKNFFDIVTYSGNGSSRTIAHNLGSSPGMVIVKRTDSTGDWWVWHRSATQYNPNNLQLNSGNASVSGSGQIEAVSSTTVTLGTSNDINNSSGTYVAYLFAHNDGDGNFGPNGDQDIIKCGVYTEAASNAKTEINLGFEAQFVIIKKVDSGGGPWELHDSARGMAYGSGNGGSKLSVNGTGAEVQQSGFLMGSPNGFIAPDGYYGQGSTMIYMAIRRGPLSIPDDATKVFSINDSAGSPHNSSSTTNVYNLGFVPDLNIHRVQSSGTNYTTVRKLYNTRLYTDTTAALSGANTNLKFWNSTTNTIDLNTSWWGAQSNLISWSWARAPGFFDTVVWEGASGTLNSVNHNLGVKPDLVIVRPTTSTDNWYVYDSATTGAMLLNDTGAKLNSTDYMASTTDTVLNVTGLASNPATRPVALLFATLAGVSKVGSYTGNGSSTGDTQTIDCGFSSGARFVLIKRTSGTGAWFVFDTVSGIVSGTDKYFTFNSDAAQVSGGDYIDPHSSGFTVVQHPATETNTNGETYLFYAIA